MQKGGNQQLKFGIICNKLTFPEWEARCVV